MGIGGELSSAAVAVLLHAPRGDELTKLGLTSFLWPPEQAHRDYIARVTDPKLETQALALFTLARHETRHFHDLLISPYGAALVREFTNLARLALACRQEILTSCSTIILPVTEWVSDWQLYKIGDASLDEPPESVKRKPHRHASLRGSDVEHRPDILPGEYLRQLLCDRQGLCRHRAQEAF